MHIGDTIKDGFKTFDGEVKKVANRPANLFTDIVGTMDITQRKMKKERKLKKAQEDESSDSDKE